MQREARKMETEMQEMIEQLRKFDSAIKVGSDKLEKICEVQQWSQVIQQFLIVDIYLITNIL